MSARRPLHVFKFGGSSVATAERIRRVTHLIAGRSAHAQRIVVVSALGGVTNRLLDAIHAALQRTDDHPAIVGELRERHADVARALVAPRELGTILAHLERLWHNLDELLDGVYLLRECSPRSRDVIISMGERASAPLVAAAFRTEGLRAVALDADEFVRTDDEFGEAGVDFEVTNQLIRDAFREFPDDHVAIVTGFVGSTDRGVVTTLGRSGSDYTATILAGALEAERVEIWTDVNGVLSADPRLVPEAVTLPQLSYREASELAYFGAKVLHPRTMRPLQRHGTPLYIKNTLDPEADGTLIGPDPILTESVVKGVTSIQGMAMIIIEGTGMMGVPGIAARAFSALAAQRINVLMISQAASEQSISVVVRGQDRAAAVRALTDAFERELHRGDINTILPIDDVAILSVVGEGMRYRSGLTGRMFATLGRAGVNVLCIAEGASDINTSVTVSADQVNRGVEALHEAFVAARDRVHVFVIGVGTVGGRVLDILDRQVDAWREKLNLNVQLVGVANSRRMCWDPNGIPPAEAVDRLGEGEPTDLGAVVAHIESSPLERMIVIDATASAAVTDHYPRLLRAGAGIVTPNKRANTLGLDFYRALKDASRRRQAPYLYETTVGAGLPVLSTLRDLVRTGDTVHRIEGVLSGTLSFVFNNLQIGRRFSEVVREAREAGYTEPDPREDLAGMDVARKALILAREIGLSLELDDVTVESLVPDDLLDVPVETFMDRLDTLDDDWAERIRNATADGGGLQYVAVIADGRLDVGVKAFDASSPLANLSATDNIVVFTTARYRSNAPLVVRGPGAGPDVTAAGIVADMITAAQMIA